MVGFMKTINQILFVVAFILLTVGCATTFRPWKLSEVKEGMNMTQVVKLLGEPDSTKIQDGAELLHYSYSEEYNPTPASANTRDSDMSREIREQQFKNSLKEYTYVVTLVDGKVLNYKETQQ